MSSKIFFSAYLFDSQLPESSRKRSLEGFVTLAEFVGLLRRRSRQISATPWHLQFKYSKFRSSRRREIKGEGEI
ncbi:hypothetical protein KQX54_018413 [Cotesia glomerata]|uniref:Uncharacterized protein n=1 Tax=Cotesia glomerata TaxID=32391 RepID=A0AAV7ID80_COTGL|nr:hypothetical protein KQX54_018413 [Cotesia glomerata]